MCADRGEGRQAYEKWWCDPDSAIVHFIGEDNTVFHALIWPAMLMADERHQLPAAVVANNFINLRFGSEAAKVSKSQTSADSPVWIEQFLKRFDADALRYYLTAIAPETARTSFDPADFVQRNNNELVAAFGNFVNRTLKFAAQYFDGVTPDRAAQTEADRAHLARGDEALTRIGTLIEEHRFKAALEEMMGYARACNEHFSVREPWRTRKEDRTDCAAAIANCIHAVHYLSVMAWPFMPAASRKMLKMLGVTDDAVRWRPPPPPEHGRPLGEAVILFEKLKPDCMS
jgi:methionyl-tRNA synthetase